MSGVRRVVSTSTGDAGSISLAQRKEIEQEFRMTDNGCGLCKRHLFASMSSRLCLSVDLYFGE